MNETFYLEAEPWKDAPFKVFLVVVTCKGEEDAIRVMREYFKNNSLEPEVKRVVLVKGVLAEELNADVGAVKN